MRVEVILIIALFALTAGLLVMAVYKTISAPSQKLRFEEALEEQRAGELHDIDLAFAENRQEKPTGWMSYWRIKGENAGQEYESPNQAGIAALRNIGIGALFGAFVFPGGAFGLVVVPLLALVAMLYWFQLQTRKRVNAMEKQLPALLSGLRSYLQAGSTPQQAIILVADEIPSPLGDELKIVKQNVNVSMPLDEALRRLSDRVPSREMKFLASSIEIAIRSGANLEPQLRTIEGVVQQRARLHSKLATAISSVRPTQIAATVAVPVFFINSLRDPDNRAFWFSPNALIFWILVIFLTAFGMWGIRVLIKRIEAM